MHSKADAMASLM